MTNPKTTIGVLSIAYDYTLICSVEDLYGYIREEGCYYTARQYCDRRYTTDLLRFTYDPYTGERIDWKEVKRLIE